ncbi:MULTISPECIES: SigE family RNA polymerase sigma factor [unclassified Plantactinospora]|uniref:SigE family RNA polymerase sigma factor n=1 Tax=unclassified Plantactinospora TaxID=2631981 RepID=UPI000D17A581|nr:MULTISPECIES: SigE family RNA polymerase sigma factor [unclassified Plantactinospora]AVT32157.1 SigE family RNA polymerase sigma factor [Plantactinospora sp. BC1]AVT40531.1 SigE family RNA polymerase sigma factor [Plantactinospora sp. BB1]
MRADCETEYVEYVTARLPALHRAAYLLSGDTHRADDIVQSTITALYRHWRRARAVDNLDGYVHRILVRKHLDEVRGPWARVRLMFQPPDRPAAPAASVEDRDTVQRLLGELTGAQRAVLVLRFACDMSVQEVAAVLNTSTGNVKSHTARGLAALRRHLDVQQSGTGTAER